MFAKMSRPSLFVGSSSEGLKIAQSVQVSLDRICEVELWTQGLFGLMKGNFESLVSALSRFDFAVLVLTPDDLSISRGKKKPSARDNVVFELGLFIGALGRDRTFILYDRTKTPALPSDLAGVTPATYEPHANGNLLSSLGAPCTLIQSAIENMGAREDKRSHNYPSGKVFSFEDIKQLTSNVHRRMECDFSPDVLVTMSGPGSIAACYLCHLNTRNIPLFVAVTFPRSRTSKPQDSLEKFLAISTTKQWRRFSTAKWEIFIPELLFQFPARTRVTVFDDRVLSGSSQLVLSEALSAVNYDVKRAAVLTSTGQSHALAWYGGIADGQFSMPWGPKDGRF